MYSPQKWSHRLMIICLSSLSGIIAPVIFLLVVITIDAIQPEHNPIVETISELVHGSYGWVQTLAFFLLGFLLIVFAARLYISTIKKITSQVGTLLVILTGLGFFLLGAFPSQTSVSELKTQQIVHDAAAGIIGTSFILGCLAYAVHFRLDPQWRKYWIYSVITVLLCTLFGLLWAFTPLNLQARGIDQLLLLVCGLLWVEIISIRLLKTCLGKA